jgi:hypothetical protein
MRISQDKSRQNKISVTRRKEVKQQPYNIESSQQQLWSPLLLGR